MYCIVSRADRTERITRITHNTKQESVFKRRAPIWLVMTISFKGIFLYELRSMLSNHGFVQAYFKQICIQINWHIDLELGENLTK